MDQQILTEYRNHFPVHMKGENVQLNVFQDIVRSFIASPVISSSRWLTEHDFMTLSSNLPESGAFWL